MRKSRLRIIGKKVWLIVSPIICSISTVTASKVLFILSTGCKLNLNNPKTFNEKLMWLKLNWQHPLVSKCADKYEVRQYIKECGCEKILTKLYGVYENAEFIEWDKFPNKFALKCTHGCGFNIICNDRSKLNKEEAIKKIKKWMKMRYVFEAVEIQYDKIKPKIICEEYIETSVALLPIDYKIYCFNGEPKLTLVCTERSEGVKLDFMDINWKHMDIGAEGWGSNLLPEKPKSYKNMIETCKKLAKPFPFVRIDFYDNNGIAILGEMTYTPAGCAARYYNEKGLNLLGDMISLPQKYVEMCTRKLRLSSK